MTKELPVFPEKPSFSQKVEAAINRVRNKEGFVQGKVEDLEREWQ